MYDRELVLEVLTQIYEPTQTISKRFEPVKSVEDFTGSDGVWKNWTPSACN